MPDYRAPSAPQNTLVVEEVDLNTFPASILDVSSLAPDSQPRLLDGTVIPRHLPVGAQNKACKAIGTNKHDRMGARQRALQIVKSAIQEVSCVDTAPPGSMPIPMASLPSQSPRSHNGGNIDTRPAPPKIWVPNDITFDGTGDFEEFYTKLRPHLYTQNYSSHQRATITFRCLRGDALIAVADAPAEVLQNDDHLVSFLRSKCASPTVLSDLRRFETLMPKSNQAYRWFVSDLHSAFCKAHPSAPKDISFEAVKRAFLQRVPSAHYAMLHDVHSQDFMSLATYLDNELSYRQTIEPPGVSATQTPIPAFQSSLAHSNTYGQRDGRPQNRDRRPLSRSRDYRQRSPSVDRYSSARSGYQRSGSHDRNHSVSGVTKQTPSDRHDRSHFRGRSASRSDSGNQIRSSRSNSRGPREDRRRSLSRGDNRDRKGPCSHCGAASHSLEMCFQHKMHKIEQKNEYLGKELSAIRQCLEKMQLSPKAAEGDLN